MALLANKHFDPVVGVDVHTVVIPPSPSPVPIPHPHVGFIFDSRELVEGAKAWLDNPVLDFACTAISTGKGIRQGVKAFKANPLEFTKGFVMDKASEITEKGLDAILGIEAPEGSSNRPILINNLMRTTSGTFTKHIPGLHFPLGASFGPPDSMPSQDSESFMGSKTVLANNDPMSFMALPAMSCWFKGLPPEMPHNAAHKDRGHDSLPTSVMLPIPLKNMVLVGGPPYLDAKALVKTLSKMAIEKTQEALNKPPSDVNSIVSDSGPQEPQNPECPCTGGDPVHLISGQVIVEQHDFTIKGRVPLIWNRYYDGKNKQTGYLGTSWKTLADTRLDIKVCNNILGAIAYFTDHNTIFELLPVEKGFDARQYDWRRGHALYQQDNYLILRTKQGIEYSYLLPNNWEQQLTILQEHESLPLVFNEIWDLNGNGWLAERDDQQRLLQLTEVTDHGEIQTGRIIEFNYGQAYLESNQSIVEQRIENITLFERQTETRRPLIGYGYNALGQLIAVYDALEQPYYFSYTERHQMLSHTDRNGLTFNYSYQSGSDGIERVVHSWGDDGLYEYHFHYNLEDQETTIVDSLGYQNILQYDERGYPISRINGAGELYSYLYDERGRTTGKIDQEGNLTEWRYDKFGNQLKKIFPDSSTIQCHYNGDHQLIELRDQAGEIWQQDWDKQGNLLCQITPTGAATAYQYDKRGQLVKALPTDESTLTFDYDRYGFLQILTDTRQQQSYFEHDLAGNLVKKWLPDNSHSQYQYDLKNRLTQCTLPGNQVLHCHYDPEDNLLSYREGIKEANGQLSHEKITQFSYFGQGQLASRTDPDGTVIRYDYDTEEQLIGVINQRGERWQLKRDGAGRLTQEVDYWGQSRHYQYDRCGHLTQAIDPLGQLMQVTCDKLGRITEKQLTSGETEQFHYNPRGQLIKASNNQAELVRDYNADGQLIKEAVNQAAFHSLQSYHYDAAGRLNEQQQILQPADSDITFNQQQHYAYNELGQLVSQQIDDHEPITFEYDKLGRLTEQQCSSQFSRHISYTDRGQIAGIDTKRRGVNDNRIRYEYDAHGNLSLRSDEQRGTDRYLYDKLGQIINHMTPQGEIHRIVYDELGNRFQITAENEHSRTLLHDNGIQYRQDKAGQLLERYTTNGEQQYFSWDNWGRLRSVKTPQGLYDYNYDPLGRRIRKLSQPIGKPTTTHWFSWDGDALSGELYATETKLSTNHYAYYLDSFEPITLHTQITERTVGTEESAITSQLYYYENDPNGMPLRLRDSDGNECWYAHYSVTGQVDLEDNSGLVWQPLRLQGQYHDNETGLHYNRYRYYDPACGVFISQDPIGLMGGLNLYQYAPNPLIWIDPLGLCGEKDGGGSNPSQPDFIVDPSGTAYPVPKGATGPVPVTNPAGKQTGVAFTGGKGGQNGQVSTIRIMDPTPPRGNSPGYPYGYIKYENAAKQGVDPYTGKTIPNKESHFPINIEPKNGQ